MKPKFEPTENGLEIIDPIERRRYRLTTHRSVTLEPVDQHGIPFPIGSATRIRTDRIMLPTTDCIFVRDHEGLMETEVQSDEQAYLPHDEYFLDISGPIKVYARVESSVYVYSEAERTHVSFDDVTEVLVGARSFHRRPADTITTTTDPDDVMEAVSAFSSALKTTSPERAYPTLRGHPPRLEIGDELAVPDSLDCPETGVRIEIPPTLRHVLVTTPLSYYLGATVVPGPEPRLVTETGYTYSLLGDGGFEQTVERVLKQLFLLDCVVRTEGTTPLPLYQRQKVEPHLEFDLASMYDRSLSERVEAYLEVESAKLAPQYPNWRLETTVDPTTDAIEFLPFLADDLAIVSIRSADAQPTPPSRESIEAIETFTRNDFTRSAGSVRGAQNTASVDARDPSSVATITQSWESIHGSTITSTTPVSAFYNNLGREPRADPIDIEVVCNDADMRTELESVNGAYGTHEQLPFNVSVHYDLTTDELENVLATESDFLHYIGHIDDRGFQCADGRLDGATIDTVGSKAFLLNACQSREQGIHLIEAGSIGGIVTLGDVVNSGAVRMGDIIAQLLNGGFPLYAALDLARIENVVGQQYLLVGDGRTTISQPETPIPDIALVENDSDTTHVEVVTYSTAGAEKGGVFTPDLNSVDSYYIVPNQTESIPVTESQLEGFFNEARFPVLLDEKIHWSPDIDTDQI